MKSPTFFVSYYHKENQKYVEVLRNDYKHINAYDTSLKKDISYKSEKRIYERIKFSLINSAVLIVLVGEHTGNRKWIDWEIWTALQPFKREGIRYKDGFRPCGILAIFLPGIKNYNIPKRLQDNIDSGYVVMMEWESVEKNRENLVRKLLTAERKRTKTYLINNSRKRQKRNRIKFFGITI